MSLTYKTLFLVLHKPLSIDSFWHSGHGLSAHDSLMRLNSVSSSWNSVEREREFPWVAVTLWSSISRIFLGSVPATSLYLNPECPCTRVDLSCNTKYFRSSRNFRVLILLWCMIAIAASVAERLRHLSLERQVPDLNPHRANVWYFTWP